MCLRCGSYSETGLRGCLTSGAACSGRMSKGSAHRASRFKRGLHPKRNEDISGPWPSVPAQMVLLSDCRRQDRESTQPDAEEATLPKAMGQKAIAAALHVIFDDPEGPEGKPDEDEDDHPVGHAFEEPPGDCFMSGGPAAGVGEPPPEFFDMSFEGGGPV